MHNACTHYVHLGIEYAPCMHAHTLALYIHVHTHTMYLCGDITSTHMHNQSTHILIARQAHTHHSLTHTHTHTHTHTTPPPPSEDCMYPSPVWRTHTSVISIIPHTLHRVNPLTWQCPPNQLQLGSGNVTQDGYPYKSSHFFLSNPLAFLGCPKCLKLVLKSAALTEWTICLSIRS